MSVVIKHQDVRINLNVPGTNLTKDFFLSKNKAHIKGTFADLTLTQWVAKLDGTVTLDSPVRGLSDAKVVKLSALEDVAIKLEKGSINYPYATVIPYGMDTDIVFSTGREEEDVFHEHTFADYALAFINGAFHPMQYIDNKVFVLNAMDSVRAYDKNIRTDFLDFTDIGKLEQYLLESETELSLLTRTTGDKAEGVQRVAIKLKGMRQTNSVAKKLPMLIINGNIRMFSDDLFIAADDTLIYKLNINYEVYLAAKNIPNTKRYLEPANHYTDAVNPTTLDVLAYLKTELCFLVLVDAPDIAYYTDYLQPSDGPMQYSHYRIPKGLIMFDDGRATHWTIQSYDANTANIITDDNVRGQTYYDLTGLRNTTTFRNNAIGTTAENTIYHRAHTLELYSFK
jgi:hypothetical protein